MTRENLITVPVGTTLDQAREILHQHKVEKLLVVDKRLPAQGPDHGQGHPEGDQVSERLQGRARPAARGAAVGIARDTLERARRWSRHVDVLVVDTAHGHSQGVLDIVAAAQKRSPTSI